MNKLTRPQSCVAVAMIAIGLFGLSLLFWSRAPEPAYDAPARMRMQILNGEFEVVTRTTGTLLFAMPGQSGDRSGLVTIYSLPSKKSCGTAPVAMVGNATLDWEEDNRIVTLSRPRSALWDLNTCTVRFHDLYSDQQADYPNGADR